MVTVDLPSIIYK